MPLSLTPLGDLATIYRKRTIDFQPVKAIETSTVLPNRADLTVTVTNQSGTVTFPAPDATTGVQRFYRAVWQ